MSPVRMGVIALCLIHRRTDSLGYLVAASIRTVGYPFTVRFRASDVLKIRVHVCEQNLLPGLGYFSLRSSRGGLAQLLPATRICCTHYDRWRWAARQEEPGRSGAAQLLHGERAIAERLPLFPAPHQLSSRLQTKGFFPVIPARIRCQ